MGSRENSAFRARSVTAKSDSGYGDEPPESAAKDREPDDHPLTRKGYEIGPAGNLQVGDVFEFLWADAHEFEWEWKCLGYTRFIVLRHSDTFPHHCVCIPISSGCKPEFAKPGIDSSQQGYVVAEGERERDRDRDRNSTYEPSSRGGNDGGDAASNSSNSTRFPARLPYSPIAIELRPGKKLRVKEDSRANYADIVEIDHDAQVMVVGSVARYFDRVRRNVNKAYMRLMLRKALEEYKAGRAGGEPPQTQTEPQLYPEETEQEAAAEQEKVDDGQEDDGHGGAEVKPRKSDQESSWGHVLGNTAARFSMVDLSKLVPEPEPEPEKGVIREDAMSPEELAAYEDWARKRSGKRERALPMSSRSRPSRHGSRVEALREIKGKNSSRSDVRSMHNVAMAGLK